MIKKYLQVFFCFLTIGGFAQTEVKSPPLEENANTYEKYMYDVQSLFLEKKYDEANKKLRWLFENGVSKNITDDYEIIDVVLKRWYTIGKLSSRGTRDIAKARDKHEKLILKNHEVERNLEYVVALNKKLNSNLRTVELCDKILEKNFIIINDLAYVEGLPSILKKFKRYDILSVNTSIAKIDFDSNVNRYQEQLSFCIDQSKPKNQKLLKRFKSNFIRNSNHTIRTLLVVNDTVAAQKFAHITDSIAKSSLLDTLQKYKEKNIVKHDWKQYKEPKASNDKISKLERKFYNHLDKNAHNKAFKLVQKIDIEQLKNRSLDFNKLIYLQQLWKNNQYVPAKKTLIKLRNKLATRELENPGKSETYYRLVSINKTLADNEHTLKIFESVIKLVTDRASYNYWNNTKEILIAAERYDLMELYMQSTYNEFQKYTDYYKNTKKRLKIYDDNFFAVHLQPDPDLDEKQQKSLMDFHKKRIKERDSKRDNEFCTKVACLIRYALYKNQLEVAKKIKSETLELIDSKEIKNLKI